MQIDWFTVGAQIVNFMVLVWLLQHFLYGPITRAMDRREAAIAARLQDAEDRKRAAESEATAYREKQAALEDQRDQWLGAAREEADALRRSLEEEARHEVAAKRGDWLRQLVDQQRTFLEDLRRRTAEYVVALARRALGDLAEAGLEDQIAAVLIDRLGGLDRDARKRIVDACRDAGAPVVVRSAFDLSALRRRRITKAIHEALGEAVHVVYERSEEITCGLELKAGSQSLIWSLDGYLDSLEDRLAGELGELAAHAGHAAAR